MFEVFALPVLVFAFAIAGNANSASALAGYERARCYQVGRDGR